MLDVVTCGEMLIDFVAMESGVTLSEATTFRKAAGGAPANVAVGVARLGYSSGFMGQVGDDDFGRYLAATLVESAVDIGGLRFTGDARTALAFVSLGKEGERSFMFYRHPSADMLWCSEEVDAGYAAQTRIFHFGSITLIGEPSRSATLFALQCAREGGALISYDPNLRPALWPSLKLARTEILSGWKHAQVIKVSQDELAFLSGKENIGAGARALWHDDLKLLVVTLGHEGCAFFAEGYRGRAPGFQITAMDTTGAGDGFVAGLLAGLLDQGLTWERESVERAVRLGNAVGALTAMKLGAIPALPDRRDVESLLASRR